MFAFSNSLLSLSNVSFKLLAIKTVCSGKNDKKEVFDTEHVVRFLILGQLRILDKFRKLIILNFCE